ncbi:hypothetical protein GF327_05835 [Candidatus Woesearchaeota archaeon]|nr:hypothetical protein [Candidatus Woesearchaeota archaeon]
MKRKLIELGGGCLVVSIPSKFVKRNKLKKGGEVEVEDNGNYLTVASEKSQESQKLILDTTEFKNFNRRILNFVYKSGYDEVKIVFDDQEILRQVESILPYLIGFEIVDQQPNYIILKNIASGIDEEFDRLLRRIFLSLKSFAGNIAASLEENDINSLNEIKLMEQNNNRMTDFLLRILKKKGFTEEDRILFIYSIIRDLEKIGDFYRNICYTLIREDPEKINKELVSILKLVNAYYEMYYDIFYSKKPDLSGLFDSYDEIKQKSLEIFDRLDESSRKVIPYVMHIAYTINHLVGPYYELNF